MAKKTKTKDQPKQVVTSHMVGEDAYTIYFYDYLTGRYSYWAKIHYEPWF
jgi:hypothetical protein